MSEAAISYQFQTDPFLSLIEPDTILPSQFLDINRAGLRGGERKLMAAILSDGIEAYLHYCTSENPENLASDICEWVHKRDTAYVFSFDVVCSSLGIDPEYLRLGLARYLAAYRQKQKEGLAASGGVWKRIRRPRRK